MNLYNLKRSRNTPCRLAITLLLLCSSYTYALTAPQANQQDQQYFKEFQDVFSLVEKQYVQDEKIDKQQMIDAAINGMLGSLDPHSSYIAGDELADFVNQTKGEFGGIGVEIICDQQGGIKVISPLDDLPAFKSGIKAGDYIVGVDGELVSSLGCNKAIKNMKGDPGTKVQLLVVKEDEPKPAELEITREIIKIAPIKGNLDPGNIAYIRIVTFNENTTKDLVAEVKKLESQATGGIKGIILDLRNNPGGLLDQATAVSDYFLPSGTIVSIKGKQSGENVIKASHFGQKAPNVPIVVLINAGSASASEIVAGALQDNKRAIILGTKSFGKGSVQSLIPVSSRASVKLTVAKYYTPNGRSIQAEGIEPDVVIELPAKIEYSENTNSLWKISESSLKNYIKNEKPKEESKEEVKSDIKEKTIPNLYKKDYQYARAYDLIKGLILTHDCTK
jgi:carboxyl-terminal processing protease